MAKWNRKKCKKNIYKILIGNKCDLEDKRKVTFQEGKDFADRNGMKFLETSAKTATKIEEILYQLTNEIINSSINKDKFLDKKENNKNLHLLSGGTNHSAKKKGGCWKL